MGIVYKGGVRYGTFETGLELLSIPHTTQQSSDRTSDEGTVEPRMASLCRLRTQPKTKTGMLRSSYPVLKVPYRNPPLYTMPHTAPKKRTPTYPVAVLLHTDYIDYNSQLFTVLGNGITSRILLIPVRYITQRSNPSPNPACRAVPYLRRSK